MKLTVTLVTAISVVLYFMIKELNELAISTPLQNLGDSSIFLPKFTWELSPYVNICIILVLEYLLGWNYKLIPIIYCGMILIPAIQRVKLPYSTTYQVILTLSLWTQKWIPFTISFLILYAYDYFQADHVLATYDKRLDNNLLQTLILNFVPFFFFVAFKQKYHWVQVVFILAILVLWLMNRSWHLADIFDPSYSPFEPEEDYYHLQIYSYSPFISYDGSGMPPLITEEMVPGQDVDLADDESADGHGLFEETLN